MVKRVLVDLCLIICGLIIVYLFLCLYLYIFQDKYIFFPEKVITATPKTYRIDYIDTFVQMDKNTKINLWYLKKSPNICLIHCNGNAGNMSDRIQKYLYFYSLGMSVIGFDYRGYGKSVGNPSEEGIIEDISAVLNFAEEEGFRKEQIVLYGESIGGFPILYIASKDNFKGVVLESTFTSLLDMAKHYYSLFPVRILLRSRFDNIERIKMVKSPVLILHSREDEIVPFSMGVKLFEAANNPKTFCELIGGHNDGGILISEEAKKQFEFFLEKTGH